MSADSFTDFKKLHSYTTTPNHPTFIYPSSSSSTPEITPNNNPYYCLCSHCTNLFSFNIHHHLGDEEGGIITSSSRWSPTPAQLLYLEQLYKQGTKTPTAQQIQLIASQLRRFGNIEAKNVFYWFQNHKARERQKRRRCEKTGEICPSPSSSARYQQQGKDQNQMCVMGLSSQQQYSPQHALQGLRGTGYEVKETKKLASSSNCSALAEVSDSLNNKEERGAHRRTQREERETQILRIKREESQEAKCQIRDMSCFLSNSKHVIIKSITTTSIHKQTSNNPTKKYHCYEEEEDEEVADDRTLELFPLKKSDEDHEDDDEGLCVTESRKHKLCSFNNASMDSDEIASNHFFEFLPLRN